MDRYQIQNRGAKLQVFASERESDVVLVFLHGGLEGGSWSLIMQQAIQQLAREYRCVFFDQRGCGLSRYTLEAGVSKADMMDDIRCIAEDCKQRYHAQKIVLFGDAFGGYFSLLFHALFPQLCDGLILCSPLLLLGAQEESQLFNVIKDHYQKHGDCRLLKLFEILKEEKPQHFFTNTHVRQYIFSDKNPYNSLRFIAATADWLFTTSCDEELQQVVVPALIMKGREDVVASNEHILNVLVRIQNPFITYETFPECGYVIYEDQPQEFETRIHQFLKDEFYGIEE